MRSPTVWAISALTILTFATPSVASPPAVSSHAPNGADKLTVGERWFPTFTEVEDSRRVDAPVILHGRLSDAAGAPLAHAEVLLSAWPSYEVRSKIPVGGEFTPVPVARAVTDKAGTYELRAAMSPLLAMRHGQDGLDLELNVFADGRQHLATTQVVHDQEDSDWALLEAQQQDSSRSAGLSPADSEDADTRLDFQFDRLGGAPAAEDIAWPEDEPTARHHNPVASCSPYRALTKKASLATVATGIARNGVAIDVTYTSSATTFSGVGWSVNAGVSFSQSGTKSRTSTFTAGYQRRTAPSGSTINREYRIHWRHHVWDRHCPTNYTGGYQTQVLTEPDVATGGGGDYNSRYADWTCKAANTPPKHNLAWTATTNATAATYASAFSINPVGKGSFSGTARSGYNSSTKVTFRYGSNGGWWCGNNNMPTVAGRVKAWR